MNRKKNRVSFGEYSVYTNGADKVKRRATFRIAMFFKETAIVSCTSDIFKNGGKTYYVSRSRVRTWPDFVEYCKNVMESEGLPILERAWSYSVKM